MEKSIAAWLNALDRRIQKRYGGNWGLIISLFASHRHIPAVAVSRLDVSGGLCVSMAEDISDEELDARVLSVLDGMIKTIEISKKRVEEIKTKK